MFPVTRARKKKKQQLQQNDVKEVVKEKLEVASALYSHFQLLLYEPNPNVLRKALNQTEFLIFPAGFMPKRENLPFSAIVLPLDGQEVKKTKIKMTKIST